MSSPDTTAMTVRLPADLAEDLATVAECDGEAVAETVRAAVSAWVARRRADPDFQAALDRYIARAQRLQVAAEELNLGAKRRLTDEARERIQQGGGDTRA